MGTDTVEGVGKVEGHEVGAVWAWSVAMAVAISFSVIALAQAWVRNRLTSRFT